MDDCNVLFSSSSSKDAGTFRLLELPTELCNLVESVTPNNPLSLTIKGQTNEDAVLCTSDKTYALRSVVLSNSILVVTPGNTSRDVVIRDQLNEILELVPSVPKIHQLNTILRGLEYDGSDEGESAPNPRKQFSYEDVRSEIQASDAELDRGLQERRVLIINGYLRPIAPTYLNMVLELLLNSLVSLSLPHHAVPIEELASALADEHEIPRTISTQAMSWFGIVKEHKWAMDVDAVVKEIGLGLLRNHKDNPIPETEFLAQWRTAVGDTFESRVSTSALSGNYLLSPNLCLTYFPASSLPVDPAARFSDLFLTRPRWKLDEIAPFLADIAVDQKERDKFLLKFARTTTDTDGVWYTARTKYSG